MAVPSSLSEQTSKGNKYTIKVSGRWEEGDYQQGLGGNGILSLGKAAIDKRFISVCMRKFPLLSNNKYFKFILSPTLWID